MLYLFVFDLLSHMTNWSAIQSISDKMHHIDLGQQNNVEKSQTRFNFSTYTEFQLKIAKYKIPNVKERIF